MKRIHPVLILIFFIFGLVISGISGYSLGLKKIKFVTEMPQILPKEIFMRAGEVEKIEGNIIFLKAKVLADTTDSGTGEVKTETLKVTVDENTEITFSGNPMDERLSEANFNDIKVGSSLYVVSLDNIKNKKEFLAHKINILMNYE